VVGGVENFVVSDNGGALDEFTSSGGRTYEDIRILRSIARPQGLEVTDAGVIISPQVGVDQLLGTVILVANASKEAAHALATRYRAVTRKNFREILARMIDRERVQGLLEEVSLHRIVVGASTKPHKFDYDITLRGSARLLLATVVPEASSVNSVLAANLDVGQVGTPNLLQRIVYDDEDEWSTANLALVGLGAPVIAFSKLHPVLERLAA
jgi:hypothetical protein